MFPKNLDNHKLEYSRLDQKNNFLPHQTLKICRSSWKPGWANLHCWRHKVAKEESKFHIWNQEHGSEKKRSHGCIFCTPFFLYSTMDDTFSFSLSHPIFIPLLAFLNMDKSSLIYRGKTFYIKLGLTSSTQNLDRMPLTASLIKLW